MISNQMNKELFDVILKNAFSDSFNRELDAYEVAATELTNITPSKEHHKVAQKVYKKKMRRNIGYATILQRTAASILIAFSIWNVVMLCSPSVQAAVKGTIAEFFDKYISFSFSKENSVLTIGTHKLGYLTEGYELSESRVSDGYEKFVFKNGDDEINLRMMASSITEVGIDGENRTMQSLVIKEYIAYALIPEDSAESTIVIWGNESCSFVLSGNVELSELVNMAKSIS